MPLPSPPLLLLLQQVHRQRKRSWSKKQPGKAEILAHSASCRQGRHEHHPQSSSFHNFSSAPLRNSPVIKLFLDLLELIKKHLCKQKQQDLSANCFISAENLLGTGPNWLLHNLVLTPAAYMERSPKAERLYCCCKHKTASRVYKTEGTRKGFRPPTKIVQQWISSQ